MHVRAAQIPSEPAAPFLSPHWCSPGLEPCTGMRHDPAHCTCSISDCPHNCCHFQHHGPLDLNPDYLGCYGRLPPCGLIQEAGRVGPASRLTPSVTRSSVSNTQGEEGVPKVIF